MLGVQSCSKLTRWRELRGVLGRPAAEYRRTYPGHESYETVAEIAGL